MEVKNLKTYFFLDEGTVRAVDGADFVIHRGETLGVVGESGCGKSVTARSIMNIVPRPGKTVEGEILYHRHVKGGEHIVDLTRLAPQSDEMRNIRGAEIAMVFQEPMTSLSPVHTVGNQITEVIQLHQGLDRATARQRAIDMLDLVGMPLPDRTIDQYAHELSGGMRQRAMIAMALSCHPSLLIADEPTTALDVTTEAQILKLMQLLQNDLGMAIMYITHNLGVIAQMTENVVVMYMGKVVERADVDTLFYHPQHPYTRALLQSIPRLGQKTRERRRLASIRGMVPDPYALPQGCAFHPRCSAMVAGKCDVEEPALLEVAPGHLVRCPICAGVG
ncbi:MAG TPA: ABC transporter ATP-binding protein [Anaerolineae bacterium]|mgnify:CR=1 FL=1|nr:ABC transporter ATP-binding protein [Anaerolineae bacterium]HQH39099.1 ABC transporter ATP-binding protein [Anaerolineae bacterium]